MEWSELRLEAEGDVGLGAGRVAGRPISSDQWSTIPNPSDGSPVATVGWGSAEHVDSAVGAAVRAQQEWRTADIRDRARALRMIADDLRRMAEPLGELICAESGKRLEEATGEVHFSARYLDWFADAITELRTTAYETPARRFLIDRKPVGVVAAVSPWNFPLSIPARKLAPAVAAGCGVVQKPSEVAPLSSLVLDAVCGTHLPAGLVNTVMGEGKVVTTALIDHSDVRAVTFTGSTEVGRIVAERSASSFTRTVLELGGRAPFIVCEDADLEQAVSAMMLAKLRNNGASCLAANNIFVHRDRYDEVMAALRDQVADVVVGDPRDAATGLGPLIRPHEVARTDRLVAEAGESGAATETYGAVPDRGSYAPVTIVEGAPSTSDAWTTELFGPVFSMRPYTDEDDLVREINGWHTGLGGYVMSDDTEHQISLARALDVGIVGINNGAPNTPEVPFGGQKASGLGYEGGVSGLLEFTVEQTLSTAR